MAILKPHSTASKSVPQSGRNIVFISKATRGDDEFVLWLAPKLEAEGYTVFADILSLDAGTRWRKEVTGTLQDRSIKMLLCCRDSTLVSDGVQEEIGIAVDLSRQLDDPNSLSRFALSLIRSCSELANFNTSISFAAGPRA